MKLLEGRASFGQLHAQIRHIQRLKKDSGEVFWGINEGSSVLWSARKGIGVQRGMASELQRLSNGYIFVVACKAVK